MWDSGAQAGRNALYFGLLLGISFEGSIDAIMANTGWVWLDNLHFGQLAAFGIANGMAACGKVGMHFITFRSVGRGRDFPRWSVASWRDESMATKTMVCLSSDVDGFHRVIHACIFFWKKKRMIELTP